MALENDRATLAREQAKQVCQKGLLCARQAIERQTLINNRVTQLAQRLGSIQIAINHLKQPSRMGRARNKRNAGCCKPNRYS
ncbi:MULTISPECIES: hypothetical protein [Spirosoma]|uniref:Uncharacterized protein n=1 Tax=Spirosoma liriopis TaxID=2937440 RepID=A0ABT0HN06_9BACT|nr:MULTISPECIES: hypothetical protein [Spirosoma]MCK8493548.1 hypothetical protein [Spirosoma liriopis]UHG92544.1 hypothetical protein LQ777_06455 [Spirosoma oryzicola]UHG93198.1 hypothetical protein LQ777_09935 [Spirosoma oryzicola]